MKVSIRKLGNDEPQDGVAKLRIASYPYFPEVRNTEYYDAIHRWYLTHPLAGEMRHWVAVTEKGETVGHLAALPQYYRIDGRRVVAHTPGDYMVLPGYSFQSFSLMRAFFRETENCVACDTVPAVISVETRLGAEVAGEMQYAAKLLNVSRLPIPPVPEPVRKLLNLPPGMAPARGYESHPGATQRHDEEVPATPPVRPRMPIPSPIKSLFNKGLHVVDETLARGYGNGLKTEELDDFDGSFDELFEKVAAVIPCVPEKDAAFLNWRYGPGSPQHPVKVLVVRGTQGLLGYAVLKVTSEGQDGYVLDLTTLPGHRNVARALLRDSVRYFRQAGAHIIRYRLLESPTSVGPEDLRRIGFFHRKGRRNSLLVKFADKDLHELGRHLDNWSYNVGDGEATFWLR